MAKKIKDLIYAKTGIDLNIDRISTDDDSQMAIASLLAVAANSDGSIDSVEAVRMVEVLCRRFPVSAVIALDLVTRALRDLAAREASPELLQELNSTLGLKQKEDLMLMLLEVIAADGEKHRDEMTLLHRSAAALGIDDRRLEKIYTRYFEARKKSNSDRGQ